MSEVRSRDGTDIALSQSGRGSPVVLVNGALGTRGALSALAGLLEPHFRVFTYDRRGRGGSGDASTYAVDLEIDDLAAVIEASGGAASVYGTSSGANLGLRAAARGLRISKLALWEPNFVVDDSRPPLPTDYVGQLNALVASGRRADAVEYFLTAAAGMPAAFVAPMRNMPVWPAFEAVAHTLAYDGQIAGEAMSGRPLDAKRWRSVAVPMLLIDGGTLPWVSHGADALAQALPSAQRRTLPGQTHDVSPDAIAPALIEFFGAGK